MRKKVLFLLAVILVSLFSAAGESNRFTVVVDAGHGGHDAGAKGAISFEKNLTLRYALAFGETVKKGCPDVRIIYTRTTDVFLPLHKRADIANRKKADLFVSFHINALDHGRISHGFQSYTLGTGERTGTQGLKENLEVAKRENSVIFMEKDYKANYKGLENTAESDIMFELIADKNRERSVELSRLMQREVCKATGRVDGGSHQNNLAVLRLTSMPAILLELGFITTPDEENFLNTDSALTLYTKGIYNAFVAYKNKYNDNISVPYRDTADDFSPAVQDAQEQTAAPKPKTSKEDSPSAMPKPKAKSSNLKPQASKEGKNQAPSPKPQASNQKNAPVFKVQIFAGKVKVADGSPQFKGLKGCESFADGDYLRYTYGSSTNYNEINRLCKEVAGKFPGAFVVAFKNGKLIDVNDAIKEFLDNKRKK